MYRGLFAAAAVSLALAGPAFGDRPTSRPARGDKSPAKPIRVALVRCDGHAYTFSPFMADCDPEAYARNFHAQFHFMIDAYKPGRMKFEPVEGFEIAKVWDPKRRKAEGVRDLFFGKPVVCETLEEAARDVDAVLINNCNYDGGDHLKLATPFLEKGIPTLIDKPMAATLKDAVAIVELARKHNAPLMSSSILAYCDEVENLKARYRELPGPVTRGVVNGCNGGLGGIIHGLTLGHTVFGPGVESVECMGQAPLEYLLMHYADKRQMLIVNATGGTYDFFRCSVWSRAGGTPAPLKHLSARPMGNPAFVVGARKIIVDFKKMIETGKPPMPYERIIELIAIVDAARLAQKTGHRVRLDDLPDWPAKKAAEASSGTLSPAAAAVR